MKTAYLQITYHSVYCLKYTELKSFFGHRVWGPKAGITASKYLWILLWQYMNIWYFTIYPWIFSLAFFPRIFAPHWQQSPNSTEPFQFKLNECVATLNFVSANEDSYFWKYILKGKYFRCDSFWYSKSLHPKSYTSSGIKISWKFPQNLPKS